MRTITHLFTAGFVAALAAITAQAPAATYVVTSIADPGDGNCATGGCTLREAIDAANANPGVDSIEFGIPGPGPHLILPASALPVITGTVSIDGSTQPGFTGTPLIEIGGDFAGTTHGLQIVDNSSQIGWLAITFFQASGIHITGSGNVTVVGCHVGIDPSGTIDYGNGLGVYVGDSPGNRIGGTTAAQRNIISGNDDFGVRVFGSAAVGNIIEGNYIGTDVTGTLAVTNGSQTAHIGGGVSIVAAVDTRIGGTGAGSRNVVSGQTSDGIEVTSGASGTLIQGNYIGIDATGTTGLANNRGIAVKAPNTTVGGTAAGAGNVISGNLTVNFGTGIIVEANGSGGTVLEGNLIGLDPTGTYAIPNRTGVLLHKCQSIVVGGTTASARNVVSGNVEVGVQLIAFGPVNPVQFNSILGNYIGTDITGQIAIGNNWGIDLGAGTSNFVGGTLPGAGNVISGNLITGLISGNSIDGDGGNIIWGNLIGTAASGSPLGNGGLGVLITGDSSGNVIGTSGPGGANTIANNGDAGIKILSGDGNTINANSMYDNGGLGIDLGGGGVTPNDPSDLDAGANAFQNYPIITSAIRSLDSTQLNVTISLQSTPSRNFRIEFFAGPCDASGYGEGRTFLGLVNVSTDIFGLQSSIETLASVPAYVDHITLTATDMVTFDTSEFSACRAVESATCNTAAGTCWTENGTTGCNQGGCCNLICDIDPFCCDTNWDALCVGEALDLCAGCGAPTAGPCHLENGTSGCHDGDCCATICAADPFCCNTEWDDLCAAAALTSCTLPCTTDCASPVDGMVDVTDLLAVLAQWGTPGFCDTDANGTVDVADLLAVLAGWGDCS